MLEKSAACFNLPVLTIIIFFVQNLNNNNANDMEVPQPPQRNNNKRGVNKLKAVVPIEIEFDSFGEAIGDNQNVFSSNIGVITRRRVNYLVDDWKLISPDEKDALWFEIKV